MIPITSEVLRAHTSFGVNVQGHARFHSGLYRTAPSEEVNIRANLRTVLLGPALVEHFIVMCYRVREQWASDKSYRGSWGQGASMRLAFLQHVPLHVLAPIPLLPICPVSFGVPPTSSVSNSAMNRFWITSEPLTSTVTFKVGFWTSEASAIRSFSA